MKSLRLSTDKFFGSKAQMFGSVTVDRKDDAVAVHAEKHGGVLVVQHVELLFADLLLFDSQA